jgi:hypothetical protein
MPPPVRTLIAHAMPELAFRHPVLRYSEAFLAPDLNQSLLLSKMQSLTDGLSKNSKHVSQRGLNMTEEDEEPVPSPRPRKIIHVDVDAFYAFAHAALANLVEATQTPNQSYNELI